MKKIILFLVSLFIGFSALAEGSLEEQFTVNGVEYSLSEIVANLSLKINQEQLNRYVDICKSSVVGLDRRIDKEELDSFDIDEFLTKAQSPEVEFIDLREIFLLDLSISNTAGRENRATSINVCESLEGAGLAEGITPNLNRKNAGILLKLLILHAEFSGGKLPVLRN